MNQRRYGYYCLPVLAGEHLIGRVDLKARRTEGTLEVLSAHFESPFRMDALAAIRASFTLLYGSSWKPRSMNWSGQNPGVSLLARGVLRRKTLIGPQRGSCARLEWPFESGTLGSAGSLNGSTRFRR